MLCVNFFIVGKHFEKAFEGSDLALHFLADQKHVRELYVLHDIKYVVFMGSLESAHDVYL